MCVIVFKPAGTELPMDVVERSFQGNRQGWGMAFFEPGVNGAPGQWMRSSGMDEDSLKATVESYITKEQQAVIHCRIASCGTVGEKNNHPFSIPKFGMLLFHNGTLTGFPTVRKDGTDSEGLAMWLNQVEDLPKMLDTPKWREGLNALITPSRVVIVGKRPNGKPKVWIIGRERGTWERGLWASNSGAFPSKYVATTVGGATHYSRAREAYTWEGGSSFERDALWELYTSSDMTYQEYQGLKKEHSGKEVSAELAARFPLTARAAATRACAGGKLLSAVPSARQEAPSAGQVALLAPPVQRSLGDAMADALLCEEDEERIFAEEMDDEAAIRELERLGSSSAGSCLKDEDIDIIGQNAAEGAEKMDSFTEMKKFVYDKPWLAAAALWFYKTLWGAK